MITIIRESTFPAAGLQLAKQAKFPETTNLVNPRQWNHLQCRTPIPKLHGYRCCNYHNDKHQYMQNHSGHIGSSGHKFVCRNMIQVQEPERKYYFFQNCRLGILYAWKE